MFSSRPVARWSLLVLALLVCGAWASAQTAPKSAVQKAGATSISTPAAVKTPAENKPKPQPAPIQVKAESVKDKEKDAAIIITPSREAAAVTFAGKHHPELAELLTQLKKTNPAEYDKAIQELFKTSERLTRTQERMPDRYEHELQAWKVDSRIRLLVARLSMSDSPALEQELKALLLERIDIRTRQNQQERDRLAARLEKLDETLADIRQGRDASAEKEFNRLKSSFAGIKAKAKKPATRKEEKRNAN